MKKFFALVFGVCLLGGVAKAQTLDSKYGLDSALTIVNASIYSEFVKQKNFKEALPAWRYVFFNAPKFQKKTYANGEMIMINLLKQTKNPAYLDTLMMIYDQRIKYFGDDPRNGEGWILGRKGGNLIALGPKDIDTKKEAYGYLTKSFDMEGAKSDPLSVQILFFTAGDLLKAEHMTRDEYINLYMKISQYIEHGLKNSKKPELFKEVKGNVDGLFFSSGVADCETLDRLLTEKYNANADDVDNLKSIISLLRRNECLDLPLYTTVVEKLYEKDPSSEAAYSLAVMFIKRQDFEKAETYLVEALEKAEAGDENKADYYLRLAQLKAGKKQYAAAKANALEALKLNPNLGAAYIMIGKAYAAYAPSYGQDAYDHASVMWAVVDKFVKAKQVDPSVAEQANKLIAEYSQHFPSKEEAFFRSVNAGSQVKIGDWINETTVARFK